ncbi:MAG: MFS transporter [Clostridia bacterium]|nr:MFS transporter [Clostridia bacterium]MBQ4620418.1 MFS transporter [Clostridia bacterium]
MSYKRTKLACHASYFTMSSVFSLPPLLFVTFRELYGISYTLLGTLVLTNFVTQLTIDLIFTAFTKYFNIKKVVRTMPLITCLGLLLYAGAPILFPEHTYAGLLIGTVIFSIAAGLSEVLLSPVIAAIPSDTPERDMSAAHSLYAFGVFTVVVITTAFLKIFGQSRWQILTVFFALLPMIPAVLFFLSPMPEMKNEGNAHAKSTGKKHVLTMALLVGCIFFGSCAENTMCNWMSGFMEKSLNIDKALGDILGMAGFAILLGLTRIAYAAYGKHISRVLMIGMIGAAVCYLTAGLVNFVPVVFAACILTGIFTAMLWPGALIFMEENVPGIGVSAYALMAAGGDLGASIAPQLMGIVTDKVALSQFAITLSEKTALTTEQIGMKCGMVVTAGFPILGIFVLLLAMRHFKKIKKA